MGGMRHKFVVVWILSLSLIAAACGGDEAPHEPDVQPPEVGDEAPPFTLPEATGGSLSLSELRGRPVLLYFSMGPG